MKYKREPVKPYDYFGTPDGEEVFQKLWYVAKPAALTTLVVGTLDVMLYSHPKGYIATFARYGYMGIPIMGCSTVFVLVTNMVASLRKADDRWNWVAGGAAAGAVLGAWKSSPPMGTIWAGVLGFAGGGKKYCHDNGIIINPSLSGAKMHGGVKAVRHDFSLLEDKTGEWKKTFGM